MKYTILGIIALGVIATFAFVTNSPSAMASKAVVGEMAPDFTAVDSNGESHKLSDFKGKNVVLEWSNHECPYVVKHYSVGNMQKLQKEAIADDVVWLKVLSSAPEKQGHVSGEQANSIAEEKGSTSTAILMDPAGDIGKLYGAKTTPHMYVVDAEGKLAYAGAIDSDSSYKAESIDGATNYVMAALGNLQDGKPVEVANTKPYGCGVKY